MNLRSRKNGLKFRTNFLQDDIRSIDPPNSPYFGYAEGRDDVRKKGETFVQKVQDFHGAYTSEPVIGGNHFAVGREVDITVQEYGRIQINQVMLYEVKDGRIVLEQFFY